MECSFLNGPLQPTKGGSEGTRGEVAGCLGEGEVRKDCCKHDLCTQELVAAVVAWTGPYILSKSMFLPEWRGGGT